MAFLGFSRLAVIFLLSFAVCLVSGCDQPGQARRDTKADSSEIVNLLRTVYQWHDKNQENLNDFDVIVKDSFQVGVNYDSVKRVLGVLNGTGYFTSGFLENYRKLADIINTKLATANPKLYNEINFSFQDADPWTGWQDSEPDYWNKISISEYRAGADSASLKWGLRTPGEATEPYVVGFKFEEGKWRVAYLQGFDVKNY